MEILRCDGIEKVFGKGDNQVTALNGISLSIEKGDFVAIIGASGSGKSTLLHILGSVDKPTKGTVTIDGVDLSRLNATDAAIFRRRKVGLVYQFYNLIPTLTAEKNILMPMRVAIARSLIYRPAILFADEPTGNLDQKNSKEIIDLLKLSNRNLKQTILLITHDEKIALEADRIVTIEDGRIVGDHFLDIAGRHKGIQVEKGR